MAARIIQTIPIESEADAQRVERLCAAGWQIILETKELGNWQRRVTLLPPAKWTGGVACGDHARVVG